MWLWEALFWAVVVLGITTWNNALGKTIDNQIQKVKIDTYHLVYNPKSQWWFAQQIEYVEDDVKEWVCKEIGNKDTIRHIYVQADYDLEKQKIPYNIDIFEINSRDLKQILKADECKIEAPYTFR